MLCAVPNVSKVSNACYACVCFSLFSSFIRLSIMLGYCGVSVRIARVSWWMEYCRIVFVDELRGFVISLFMCSKRVWYLC